jgi:RecB family exonuclease
VTFDTQDTGARVESVREAIKQALKKEVVSALHREDYNKAIEKILVLAKINHRDKEVKKEIFGKIGEPDVTEICEQIDKDELRKEKEIIGPMRFSVSQFGTYKRCPRVYRYRYVYRLPAKPKPYFDFGGSIHSVVEHLTKIMNSGQEVDMDTALKLLDKHWRSDGYTSKAQEQQEYEQGKEILKVFLEENAKIDRKTVGIEKQFTINMDGHEIYGIIDRIDEDGDDLIVLDYKTSKQAISKNKLREDLQLLTYTLGAEQLFGRKPKQIGLWFLRLNKIVTVDVNDEDVEKVKEEALSIICNILQENFEPTPGWECRYCDYGMLCDDKA